MGDIFNHHRHSVFYMYDPLQSAQRVPKQTDQNMSYRSIVEQLKLLTGIFDCKFVQPQIVADFERYYRKPTHPGVSQSIASQPLCP